MNLAQETQLPHHRLVGNAEQHRAVIAAMDMLLPGGNDDHVAAAP